LAQGQAEQIQRLGSADLFGIAREFFWDPYWTVHAARERGMASYFDLLPRAYGWRLKRRDEIRRVTRNAAQMSIAPDEK
jgi:2,4-dienoyl-CoA reductase-like NADH-dependent reductase (Old Yellow Enzyme family)